MVEPDEPTDVYFIVKGEKVQLTPREVKHLRRAVKIYDWSRGVQKGKLAEQLTKLGWAGKSINRKVANMTPDRKKRIKELNYCFICSEDDPSKLTIHHRIPAVSPDTNNHRKNLVVLCRRCHLELHKSIIKELQRMYSNIKFRNTLKRREKKKSI